MADRADRENEAMGVAHIAGCIRLQVVEKQRLTQVRTELSSGHST